MLCDDHHQPRLLRSASSLGCARLLVNLLIAVLAALYPAVASAQVAAQTCGNGVCEFPETCHFESCQPDCGTCPDHRACWNNLDCESGICNYFQCIPARLPGGARCTTDAACETGLCDLGKCVSGCGDNTCSLDETCFSSPIWSGCQADCGACPDGHFCFKHEDCASDVCNFQLCLAGPQGGGTPCTSDWACRSGECFYGLCAATCGDGNCETLGAETCYNCRSDCGGCPNGSPCTAGSDCASNICCGLFCAPGDLSNGQFCACDSQCRSGLCNFLSCTAAGSLPAGSPCEVDRACRSGDCVAGLCAARCGDGNCEILGAETCYNCRSDCGGCPNGSPCTAGSDCASNICCGLVCAAGDLTNGQTCACDSQCRSGLCNITSCIAPGSLSAGSLCEVDRACRSGDCVAGLCAARCGDGNCELLETCLTCSSDCGRCGNGTPCVSHDQCASNICNCGFCVAGGWDNGRPCCTGLACSSGCCLSVCSPSWTCPD